MMKKVTLIFGFLCFLQILGYSQEVEMLSSFQFNEEQVLWYHKSTANQQKRLLEILESSFFSNSEDILDLGCGDGKITALLSMNYPNSSILGCDISKEMIEFASKQYNSEKYPNLRFIEKDACNLGFSNKFDRIFSLNCLHWTKDQQKALKEIYASLKPNGKALIITSPKSSEDDLQLLCFKIVSSSKGISYFRDYKGYHSFFSKEEYEKMLANALFSIEKIHQSILEVIFEDRASLEILLKAVLTPLYHLPENNRSSFLDDLFAGLEELGRVDSDGKVHLHISQIELIIKKQQYDE